jgi:hypothetical protein
MIVIPVAYVNRDRLNPDTVPYVRRALYLADGNFAAFVSGYWSPMMIASMVPWIKAGMDPVYAARAALAVWGALYVLAIQGFLAVFTRWDWRWRTATGCAIAVMCVPAATRVIVPDIVLGTCLYFYFSAVCTKRYVSCRRWQFVTGLIGGVAYMAKSYALPFLAVHIPFVVFVRLIAARERGVPLGQRIRSAALALFLTGFGVFVAAGPWLGALWWKYGKPTISTSGAAARAMVRPSHVQIEGLDFLKTLELAKPAQDPYISHGENPDAGPQLDWSPFADEKSMRHQLDLTRRHAGLLWQFLVDQDRLFVGPAVFVLGVLLVLVGRPRLNIERWRIAWLVGTAILYCSGFLMVWFQPRYVESAVIPLIVILAASFVQAQFMPGDERAADPQDSAPLEGGEPATWNWALRWAIGSAVLAGFVWPAYEEIRLIGRPHTGGVYREVANLMRKEGFQGPLATSNRYPGWYISLYNNWKTIVLFEPRPKPAEQAVVWQALLASKPATVLVFTEPPSGDPNREAALANSAAAARELAAELGYTLQWTYDDKRRKAEVYAAPKGATTTAPSATTRGSGS